jgi:hypothetical protein
MRFVVGCLLAGLGAALIAAACGEDFDPSEPVATGGAAGAGGEGGAPLADAGSVYGLATINPECGAGDGGTTVGECTACTLGHCATELESCFGATWETTLVGGVCEDLGTCVDACACGDNACFQACLTELEASTVDPCWSCVLTLISCQQASCSAECADETEPDGGHGADAGDG